MRVHITSLYGMMGVVGVSQRRTAEIGRQLGFNELGIFRYPVESDTDTELSKRYDGISAGIGSGDIVIYQGPTFNGTKFDDYFITNLRWRYGQSVKVIIFVEDIVPMMYQGNEYLFPQVIDMYNKAHALIVASENMKEYLIEKGVENPKIYVQNLWDLPEKVDTSITPKFMKRISFTGNDGKFGIMDAFPESDVALEVYGSDKREDVPQNINFNPFISDEHVLLNKLREGGFGLVWAENEHVRNYMHYCNSYKVSTYLRAGIPVIAHKSISCAKLLEKNHWGILADTLEEAVDIIDNMSDEEYQKYIESVGKVGFLLENGYFTKKVLNEAIYGLYVDD